MYQQKCADLRLVSSDLARKRFMEQFFNSVGRKSVHFSGLGLGVGCAALLVSLLIRHPRFVFLDLSFNRLSDSGVSIFSEFLASDPPIVSLDLGWNKIGVGGSVSLFRALMQNTHLTELDISAVGGLERNRVGTSDCVSLAGMLSSNETLSRLNAAFCGVTAEGCNALGPALAANRTLTFLDLTANRFRSTGCALLFGEHCSGSALETLVLSRTGLDDSASASLCRAVRGSRSLRRLDVSENRLGRQFLVDLYDALDDTRLKQLNLRGNEFGGCAECVAALVRTFGSI
jgi:Ran GTPase-activating protein (RanGAP) involved in mRNA processing and transport